MKAATPALVAHLNAVGGINPDLEWDFYTFVLADGTMLRYGTAGFTMGAVDATIWNPPAIDGSGGLWFDGITWTPSLMGVQGAYGTVGHWKIGLDADTFSLQFAPRPIDPVTGEPMPDKINGSPWIDAARSGALDEADCIVSTAYYAAMPDGPIAPGGLSPVGSLVIARGKVGNVDCSDTAAYISVTDYRAQLGQMMPRNQYGAGCRHRVYDTRCTLDPATFTQAGVVATNTINTLLTSVDALPAPGGSNTYALGVLTMTSGRNAGFKRLVVDWDGASAFQLLSPFPFPVSGADAFTVTAGCDKSTANCTAFGNLPNFGGEPYIPIPETAIG